MTNAQDRKLLKLWREVGIIKARGRCEICGVTGLLNAHHYIGRKDRQLRWDSENCVVLCYSHHKGQKLSAHENPEWFRNEMLQRRGKKWLLSIYKKSQQQKGLDYEKIKIRLERELQKYNK